MSNPLNAYYNTNPAHMTINSYDIISAQSYQRKVYPQHVREIISKFDPCLFDEPTVSCRDGKYYLIDGQNRITALVALNHGNPVNVRCKVFKGLSEADEANLFAKQDKLSRKLTPFEYLNASAFGSDKDSETTRKFLTACNDMGVVLTAKKSSARGSFLAANTLYRAYKTYGDAAFRRVIPLMLDTWDGDYDSKRSQFINAMFTFDKRYSKKYSRRRFVASCGKLTPSQLLFNSKSMVGSDRDGFCSLLVNAYNHGLHEEYRI